MMFFRRQRASANDGLPWPRSSEWRRTLAATVRTSVQGVQGKEPQPTVACSVRRRGSPWRFGLVLLLAAAARGQEHAWARRAVPHLPQRCALSPTWVDEGPWWPCCECTPHVGARMTQAGSRPCAAAAAVVAQCRRAACSVQCAGRRTGGCGGQVCGVLGCSVRNASRAEQRRGLMVWCALGVWCAASASGQSAPVTRSGRSALQPPRPAQPVQPAHAATGMGPFDGGNLSQTLNCHRPPITPGNQSTSKHKKPCAKPNTRRHIAPSPTSISRVLCYALPVSIHCEPPLE
jgi:hypothetical protein